MGEEARQRVAVTVIVFAAEHQGGEAVLSEEHDAYRWCKLEELSRLGVPKQLVEAARGAGLGC